MRVSTEMTVSISFKLVWAIAATAALLLVACDDPDEELLDATEPALTASASPLASDPAASPSSTTPLATRTSSAEPTPALGDKEKYIDSELGFSFEYDRALRILNESTDGHDSAFPGRRSVYVGGADDPLKGFAVWVHEDLHDQPFDWWVDEFICLDGTESEGEIDGEHAVFCMQWNQDGPPGHAVLTEHDGKLYIISSGGSVTEDEFGSIVEGFQF